MRSVNRKYEYYFTDGTEERIEETLKKFEAIRQK